eukprot:TRINITY_DN1762_c0_g1_i1.p1 TRINITY_DN1762_c0_g1~~TRINITY_DN1762_c0_g1_i1.p1  ORF type:complete len:1390 (+),score=319.09 TRINITY_DN1762_c0_g1_i1:386-4555(+)
MATLVSAEPILFVAVAEFDIDRGNTLSVVYPPSFDFTRVGLTENLIADMCLPDGAHLHERDWTYLTLTLDEVVQGEAVKTPLYGISTFKNKPDASVRRGAIQKAMLCMCRIPIYDVLFPLLTDAISHFIDSGDGLVGGDATILKSIYEAFNDSSQSKLTLNGQDYKLKGEPPKEDEYPGISLTKLLERFGVDVMYLWYAILLEQRILFSGQPAGEVGECCLAAPLLVAPIKGFHGITQPYVALTEMSTFEKPTFICGSTNALFETKTDWYDVLGSFSTGIIKPPSLQMSKQDRAFISNVLNGMGGKNELWVRAQFRNYTQTFVEMIQSETVKDSVHKQLASTFQVSALYERYRAQQKGLEENRGAANKATEAWNQLKTQKLSDKELMKRLWELLQNLVDLHTLEMVVDEGGVNLLAMYLDSASTQIRKYAVLVLAQLAISTKGQTNLLKEKVLVKVGSMLNGMTNVANAACYCLFKVSSLYIGAHSLVIEDIHKRLFEVLVNEDTDLLIKKTAAQTLLNIYSLKPETEIVNRDAVATLIKKSKKDDVDFIPILYQLFDSWGEVVSSIPVSQTVAKMLAGLAETRKSGSDNIVSSIDPRLAATSFLLSEISSNPYVVMQIAAGGGVKLLVDNASDSEPEEPLGRLSWAVLCVVADTAIGCASLKGHSVVEGALKKLAVSTDVLLNFYIMRFIEVCAQHDSLAELVVKKRGVEILWEKFEAVHDKPLLTTLCLPALGAFKFLLLLHRPLLEEKDAISIFAPIKVLFQNLESVPSLTSHHEVHELVKAVVHLLDPPFYEKIVAERAAREKKAASLALASNVNLSILDSIFGSTLTSPKTTRAPLTARDGHSTITGYSLKHAEDPSVLEVNIHSLTRKKVITVHLPGDLKKSVIMKPMESLEKLLIPICELREIDMEAFVATNAKGEEIPLSILQGSITNNEVFFTQELNASFTESQSQMSMQPVTVQTHQGGGGETAESDDDDVVSGDDAADEVSESLKEQKPSAKVSSPESSADIAAILERIASFPEFDTEAPVVPLSSLKNLFEDPSSAEETNTKAEDVSEVSVGGGTGTGEGERERESYLESDDSSVGSAVSGGGFGEIGATGEGMAAVSLRSSSNSFSLLDHGSDREKSSGLLGKMKLKASKRKSQPRQGRSKLSEVFSSSDRGSRRHVRSASSSETSSHKPEPVSASSPSPASVTAAANNPMALRNVLARLEGGDVKEAKLNDAPPSMELGSLLDLLDKEDELRISLSLVPSTAVSPGIGVRRNLSLSRLQPYPESPSGSEKAHSSPGRTHTAQPKSKRGSATAARVPVSIGNSGSRGSLGESRSVSVDTSDDARDDAHLDAEIEAHILSKSVGESNAGSGGDRGSLSDSELDDESGEPSGLRTNSL